MTTPNSQSDGSDISEEISQTVDELLQIVGDVDRHHFRD
jgi:hypothetical protein